MALAEAEDLHPKLGALHVPVTLCVGEEDRNTPLADARRIHEALPDATLHVVAGARHLVPWFAPELTRAVLTEGVARARP